MRALSFSSSSSLLLLLPPAPPPTPHPPLPPILPPSSSSSSPIFLLILLNVLVLKPPPPPPSPGHPIPPCGPPPPQIAPLHHLLLHILVLLHIRSRVKLALFSLIPLCCPLVCAVPKKKRRNKLKWAGRQNARKRNTRAGRMANGSNGSTGLNQKASAGSPKKDGATGWRKLKKGWE